MNLFSASGVDIDTGGGRGRKSDLPRALKTPLLKHKVVQSALDAHTFDFSGRQIEAAANYARTVKSKKFARMKETEVRPLFCDAVLCEFLGYTKISADGPHSLTFELPLGRGSADVALGRFGDETRGNEVVAPFELKGPATHDLDAIPPGRGRSPVQQAWDYANDAPGCRWVLVSNCIELRLYGFGRGREAYEVFDLRELDDRDERERLWLLLAATRLLGRATDALLKESDGAYKAITDKLYEQYKGVRTELINYLVHETDGPKLTLADAIGPAQKILDRILFIAFAQRTALLPDKLLERAKTADNEFNPQPLWRNFQQLFRSVDEGNKRLSIWPYNGGLFAHDAVVDAVYVPDPLVKGLAKLGEWDYRDDVPVTLLGHLFEQSVTDLEKLRAVSRGEPAPKVTKKKREGVVYTPDMATRFLTAKTIGVTLGERFDALLESHGKSAPRNGDPIFTASESELERAFWRDYAGALRSLRIVDPACGSGAFLVAAFDLLAAEYRRVAARLGDLGAPIDFDPFDEIVTKNLYGVDLNAESVEITRLALWLKTARSEHRLQNLEATIKVGNSLIDDPAYTDHPFDWRKAFPEVFAGAGFDIVIGNPPYVRMELIKPVKPYLEERYVVAADRADLYAYFFEKGVGVLKDGGRLGFISSSTFFRTGSGENLRTFLGGKVAIETIVDFSDVQIFEGVTTYPAILTLKRSAEPGGAVAFMKIEAPPEDLEAEFAAAARAMPRARLGSGPWQLEDDALARLRGKIVKGKKTLGEVYGAPLYGIKTGLNDAFIIDQETRERLVKRDPKSAEILVPFLRGENIKRWRVKPEGLYLINTPKGKVDIDKYPAVRDWLLPFRKNLEARATKQEWFELQQAQLAYQTQFVRPKVVYLDIADSPPFALDAENHFIDCTAFMVSGDYFLLAFLNSRAAWFQWVGATPIASGGYLRLKQQYVAPTAIPTANSKDRRRIAKLGQTCSDIAGRRHKTLSSVGHRIGADLGNGARLSRKLEDWHDLDFAAFRAEIKRVFKAEIPVKQRGEWEKYLAEESEKVRTLTAGIEAAEREIDKIVYGLFDLTAAEIELLEASLEGQY